MNITMKMNRIHSFVAAFAVACAFAAVTEPASAGSLNECKDRISTVRSDVYAVTFYTPDQDRTKAALAGKLDAAVNKLNLPKPKYDDAVQKLRDFKSAVELMRDAAKPKISNQDATLLLKGSSVDRYIAFDEGVEGAIACVLTPYP